MNSMPRISAIVLLLAPAALFGAVHHTAAHAAYFKAHGQCVRHLHEAKKDASAKVEPERKKTLDAAKEEYRRCEAHAHLIWKYYPSSPPPDVAPATPGSSGATPGRPPHR